MNDWTVVRSITGRTKDGLPAGETLCRYKEDVPKVMERMEIPEVLSYDERMKEKEVNGH